MDWTKILRPKLCEFRDMEEYSEWLCKHSEDIPKAGEVYCFRVHAEDYFWIKIGDGVKKISDLWPFFNESL